MISFTRLALLASIMTMGTKADEFNSVCPGGDDTDLRCDDTYGDPRYRYILQREFHSDDCSKSSMVGAWAYALNYCMRTPTTGFFEAFSGLPTWVKLTASQDISGHILLSIVYFLDENCYNLAPGFEFYGSPIPGVIMESRAPGCNRWGADGQPSPDGLFWKMYSLHTDLPIPDMPGTLMTLHATSDQCDRAAADANLLIVEDTIVEAVWQKRNTCSGKWLGSDQSGLGSGSLLAAPLFGAPGDSKFSACDIDRDGDVSWTLYSSSNLTCTDEVAGLSLMEDDFCDQVQGTGVDSLIGLGCGYIQATCTGPMMSPF